MSSFQVIAEKVAQVASLTTGFLCQAASNLVGSAEKLPLDEMSRRIDGALGALKGGDVPTSAVVTTAQDRWQAIAQELIDSYQFRKSTRESIFTVPAGVTDVDAMKALNEYFRNYHRSFQRDAVHSKVLPWVENLPLHYPTYCEKRDYSEARQITITGVVNGTKRMDRRAQGSVLKDNSFVFSDPRDQALAAAIHACKHNGEDLFQDLWVRGSVPGFALSARSSQGLRLDQFNECIMGIALAASGSPPRNSSGFGGF